MYLERKIFVLVCTLVMILAAITIPRNIKVEAVGGGGGYDDPGLDHGWIYQKIVVLSKIVDTYSRGRDFGEPGEIYAANKIEEWMDDIGLTSTDQEQIDAKWRLRDSWDPSGDTYCGELEIKRQFDNEDYSLEVRVINRATQQVVDSKTFSFRNDNCFPLLKGPFMGRHNVNINHVRVFETFNYF
jgi:hypothetical protein